MRTLTLSVLLFFLGTFCLAQAPVDATSKVLFTIKNFGFTVNGSFRGLQGKIAFDPASPASSTMDVSLDANTVNTGNNMRDNHLRKDEYLDVQNYPRIQFISTGIEGTSKPGEYLARGRLTIKKTTRDVFIPFTASATAAGYFLKGEFKINRRDFGVGGNNTISDNLQVCLEVNTRRQ